MTEPKKRAKEVFDETRQQFREAHIKGIQNLRDRNLAGVGEAIEKERSAIEKAASLIESASTAARTADRAPAPTRHGFKSLESDESLDAEHARLLEQLDALEREHRELEANPYDREARRGHRDRLQLQISALRAHMRRLRGEPEDE